MSFPRNLADNKAFFGDRTKKGAQRRPPARTFREMAEEFGLAPGQLRWQMGNSKHEAPAPVLCSTNNLGASNKYYNRQEMRNWWKLHSADKEA